MILMRALKALETEAINDKLSHAYLFLGGNKSQRHQVLEFFTKTKQCFPEDILEIISENSVGRGGEIKIDTIRDMVHSINLSPSGPSRIVVIHQSEKLNNSSGNILLKILEEPPSCVTFLLFASTPAVLPTIKSRCRVVDLNGVDIVTDGDVEMAGIFKLGFFEASKKIEEIIKGERVEEFLSVVVGFLRELLLKTKNPVFAKEIRELESDRAALEQNANAKLTLECLYLRIKELI